MGRTSVTTLKLGFEPLGSTRGRRLLLRVVLYGGAIFIGLPVALSVVMTRTHSFDVSATPSVGYEAIELESDGLTLRAWIARGEPGKAAFVIAHGLGDNLESYLGPRCFGRRGSR